MNEKTGAAAEIANRMIGLAALVLLLNLREKDYYDHGSLAPVDPFWAKDDPVLYRLVPETYVHPCPACGRCGFVHGRHIPAGAVAAGQKGTVVGADRHPW